MSDEAVIGKESIQRSGKEVILDELLLEQGMVFKN